MPCRDPWMDDEIAREEDRKCEMFEATLCGIFTYFEDRPPVSDPPRNIVHLFEKLDFEEMGVSRREVIKWWKEHRAIDEERRKREAEETRKVQIRNQALARLSLEEREALGL